MTGIFPLHSGLVDGTVQIILPVARSSAFTLPAASEPGLRTSDTGTYIVFSSADDPHSTPPNALPRPTRASQTIAPLLSGSRPKTMPDFWPTASIVLPFASVRRIGEPPRSKSGPGGSGQFSLPRLHEMLYQSFDVICRVHAILPLSRSMASTESVVPGSGSL